MFPVLPLPGYILCALYGLWLGVAVAVYIFVPRSTKKLSTYALSNQTSQEVADIQLKSRNSSFSSLKGPQRLDKNIISDDKMVQLRKKSIDFLESNRARDQLNLEFRHHPLYSKPYGNGQYVNRSDSKPDQESDSESDDLETSQVSLLQYLIQARTKATVSLAYLLRETFFDYPNPHSETGPF